jgi:hypothetical protein
MNTFPIVKVTVDHMRQEILHAFTSMQLQQQIDLDAALKEVVSEFDFDTIVKEEAEKALDATCRSVVSRAISTALWDKTIRLTLEKQLIAELTKQLSTNESKEN